MHSMVMNSSLKSSMVQLGKFANPVRGSAEQIKMTFSLSPSRLRISSRVTGSAVPSRVSLFILHTPAESGAYSR